MTPVRIAPAGMGRLAIAAGMMYVPQDEARAVEYWQRAARAGHTRAQEKLRELGQTW